jgi:hypothetical protein
MTQAAHAYALESFDDVADMEDAKLIADHVERVFGPAPSIKTLEAVLVFFKARRDDIAKQGGE